MKWLIILLFILIALPLFANNDEIVKALEESNKLLEVANNEISKLEKEIKSLRAIINNDDKARRIKELESEVASRDSLLEKADVVLESSNDIFEKANKRIGDDQTEIQDLRNKIMNLITAGTELETYKINFLLGYGYPHSVGFDVAVNFPFFSVLGVYGGAGYFFEQKIVYVRVGIKLNVK